MKWHFYFEADPQELHKEPPERISPGDNTDKCEGISTCEIAL